MKHFTSSVILLFVIFVLVVGAAPDRARAQSYQIDCAILLCLSGGWPASAPCARARAEFIRRITPWPIEPPLQIWRCPMGVSYEDRSSDWDRNRVYDILFERRSVRPQSQPNLVVSKQAPYPALFRMNGPGMPKSVSEELLEFVQQRADIDISGPEFNFVRSIRVFDARAWQRESGDELDRECNRYQYVRLGSYGTQGEFSWRSSGIGLLPQAHTGTSGWGETCPNISHRSVFVEWRDHQGNYGFEQVNY